MYVKVGWTNGLPNNICCSDLCFDEKHNQCASEGVCSDGLAVWKNRISACFVFQHCRRWRLMIEGMPPELAVVKGKEKP